MSWKIKLHCNQPFFTYQNGKLKGQGINEQLEVNQCFLCAGVWFDKGELEKYLAERVRLIGSTDEAAFVSKATDDKVGKCPRCNVEMKKERAPKDSSVTIDRCGQCGGVWLDDVETDKLERASVPVIERFLKKVMKYKELMNKKNGKSFNA